MPSFAWTSRFREGQWRAFRKFMLEERMDAGKRFAVIDAERERIGSITILWELDDNGNPTEKQAGFSVSPPNSSLAKLVRAYTAMGGNPFDISMFVGPDSSQRDGEESQQTAPHGGVLAMQDVKYAYDQGVQDGDGNFLKYKSSRLGGRRVTEKEFDVAAVIQKARGWVSQEIWWKRNRLEEQIIKLCDLREQLDHEVEDLIWATGGDVGANYLYDSERYNDSLTAGGIAYFFDSTFRIPDATDTGRVPVDNEAEEGAAGAPNLEVLGGYPSLMSDRPEEEDSAL